MPFSIVQGSMIYQH